MAYEETLSRLSEQTARSVLAAWAAVQAGQITLEAFKDLALIVVQLANRQGYSLGHLSIRAYLEATTGEPSTVPAEALAAPAAVDRRLRLALATITEDYERDDEGEDEANRPAMRLERLATNEPVQAATSGARDAMDADERVTGWTRGLEGDACQLCTWWWREGRVWQPDHRMPRHVGCNCHPVPVVNVATDNYQTAKQARGRARETGRLTA